MADPQEPPATAKSLPALEAADAPRQGLTPRPRLRPVLIVVPAAIVLVLTAYVWLVSVGAWTAWPRHYDYSHFDKLASAFGHGQLFLLEQPDPALLALPDPYDPAARAELPYIGDASLYKGKYYLYFGPVPAMLLLIPKAFTSNVIPDVYLVFAFICAVFLIQAIFILRIRKRIFPNIPIWLVGVCIIFVGLSTPFGWILGNAAQAQNAAIAAGQFFFLAGLLMAFEALADEQVHRAKATCAGGLWAAALGSRVTLLLPIAFVMLLVLLLVLQKRNRPVTSLGWMQDAVPFAAPLLLGAAALAWYNWARFGSAFESGLWYQLATPPMRQYWHELFSGQYVVQNLFNYLLNPPTPRFAFPYLWPHTGLRNPVVPDAAISPIYYTEENTGLVYVAPFLVFGLAAAAGLGRPGRKSALPRIDQWLLLWLEAALAGSFVLGFGLFLLFFWASNRYLLDFLPSALLLSVVGFWQICEALNAHPLARSAVILLGLGLMAASLLVSTLVTLGQNADAFSLLDEGLWKRLNKLLRHVALWQDLMRLYQLRFPGG